MDKEIDLSRFNIRTDLAIDCVDKNTKLKGVKCRQNTISGLIVTSVDLDNENDLNKKKGKYITIEFDDVTDHNNELKVTKVLTSVLRKLIKSNHNTLGLIVGLGNNNSTPDSLGPLTVDNIIVTNHIYNLGCLSKNYSRICAIKPSVLGETGIETGDIIESIVKKIKPDYLIAIDSLASSSIERLNKTIQITDTGIHPGSGIGNERKEISKDTLGIPVYAIGIPTVASASVIVKDTINFIYKNYEINKESMNKTNLISDKDRRELLGYIGTLEDEELNLLINEVLNPIGYNFMVTPKEVDFIIKKMSNIVSNSINNSVHKIDKSIQ